jgi:hypothetical protein
MGKKYIFLTMFIMLLSFRLGMSKNIDVKSLSDTEKWDLLEKFDRGLNKLSSKLDGMLSKKGALKTLIVTFPFISLYAYLFPPEPIMDILGRIINHGIDSASEAGAHLALKMFNNTDNLEVLVTSLGEIEAKYNLSKQIGEKEAFWEMLLEKPLGSLTLMASSLSEKVWNNGLPFLSVIAANKLFNVQR